MDAASSETSEYIYQCARCHTAEYIVYFNNEAVGEHLIHIPDQQHSNKQIFWNV
jgi:hypothetical protein